MANEFRHGSVGTDLTQAEWESITGHSFDAQATGDMLYASSATQLSRLGVGANLTTVLSPAAGIPSWAATLTSLLFSSFIAIGTNPAAAGLFRLANNANGIRWRNAGNTADIWALDSDGANAYVITEIGVQNRFRISTGGAIDSMVSLTSNSYLATGSNPAAAGAFRGPNNPTGGVLSARNAANSGNIAIINLDASDRLALGLNTLSLVLTSPLTQTTVGAAGAASALPANPTGYLRWTDGTTQFVVPYYAQA